MSEERAEEHGGGADREQNRGQTSKSSWVIRMSSCRDRGQKASVGFEIHKYL